MARILALLLLVGASATQNCTRDKDCTDSIDNTCVIDENGWSQCISCSNDQYQVECSGWDGDLRNAAKAKCQITCETPLACTSDANCTVAPADTCSANGVEGFCVSCNQTKYQNECPSWTDEQKASGEATCSLHCGDMCQSDGDCVDMESNRHTCVVQDSSWSNCVNCATFDADCDAWSADFQAAAGATCGGLTCPTTDDVDDAATCADDYKQCGGDSYDGPSACCDTMEIGMVCTYQNDHYSQCLPATDDGTRVA